MDENSLKDIVLSVSDFVSLVNQTFDYAYPSVVIRGEVSNYKLSKNKWVYFNLKDDESTVRFFGNIYQLSSPIEDGMLLRVYGKPNLHKQYGFSVTILSLQPDGDGMLRRAADLLRAKLQAEGLFDEERKRLIPYPPIRLGLITSLESAAYTDFIKILDARWQGLAIECIDVQVQGRAAPEQIITAIEYFNQKSIPPDVLVLTRGGGSQEDLYTFDTEQVTRAVSGSRVPTLIAIGHEKDVSLVEMAADKRASTPSNAAELLVPNKYEALSRLDVTGTRLDDLISVSVRNQRLSLKRYEADFEKDFSGVLKRLEDELETYLKLLEALNPRLVLKRGYSIIRLVGEKKAIRYKVELSDGDIVDVELSDGKIKAVIR
ncbi:MAG: exodeoxyribonuclease VII large subunit [Candidatus Saccharimonadales bacterium]